jgi:DNA-binding IclR family transcriptional regulator
MTRLSPAVIRTLAVLDFFADHPLQKFTMMDIVRSLKLSRATCHGLLAAFVEAGYLYRNDDKSYVLGPRLVTVGRVANQYYSPLAIARSEMRKLADDYDAVCSAVAREGDEVVTRERAASASHLGWALTEGARTPLRPPAGTVFMAWEPHAEIEAWLAKAIPPLAPAALARRREAMAVFREKGFCFAISKLDPEEEASAEAIEMPGPRMIYFIGDLEPDQAYDLSFVTAPVFNAHGRVDFALGVQAFTRKFTGREIEAMGKRIRAICDRTSEYMAQPRIGQLLM